VDHGRWAMQEIKELSCRAVLRTPCDDKILREGDCNVGKEKTLQEQKTLENK